MKNKILLFGSLLAILTYAAVVFAEDNNELADVYYQSGLALFKQNKHDEAIEKFNKALSYKQDFPQALFKLGECCEKVSETKKAVDNYRLSLKYLKQQKTLSKEENELLVQVCRCIDKLDINSNEFGKMKNDYISGLLTVANDCFNKRCQRFSLRLVQSVLEIDESNKTAQALLAKIDKKIITSLSAGRLNVGPPRELFNGKDLKNWKKGSEKRVDSSFCEVENSRIIVDPVDSNNGIWLVVDAEPPDEYTLTIKFKVLKYYLEPSQSFIAAIYGHTIRNTYVGGSYNLTQALTGENEVKFIKYKDKYELLLNGKSIIANKEEMKIEFSSIDALKIGMIVRGAKISISKVTVQEFKKPTPDTPEGIQSKKLSSPDKKEPAKELFNGKDFSNWTIGNSDSSVRDCWTIRQGKINVNTKYPKVRTVLFWNGKPPANYKLTIDVSIEGPVAKDKDSRMGIIYGSLNKSGQDDLAFDVSSIYLGEMPKSHKLEIIRTDNLYKIIRDGSTFREFEQEKKPPVIGILAQNIRMSISSIKLEELDEK
ncbi:MAG: tetratricopeptide repeat protein [Planctomycetes bacterium]|nr:tetratricopeptide repeat protein [Planctomycetota bacterium]